MKLSQSSLGPSSILGGRPSIKFEAVCLSRCASSASNSFKVLPSLKLLMLKLHQRKKQETEKELERLPNEEKCVHVFLTCVDLETAENWFLVIDDRTRELLEKTTSSKGISVNEKTVSCVKRLRH